MKPWKHADLFNGVGTIEKNKAECDLISHHSKNRIPKAVINRNLKGKMMFHLADCLMISQTSCMSYKETQGTIRQFKLRTSALS